MKKLEELNLEDKKVIIFDLDGTLIDSIGIWNMTDHKLIHDYSGKEIDLKHIQTDRDYFLHHNSSSDIYVAYCEYLINKYEMNIKNPSELSDIRRIVSNEVLSTKIDFKPDVVKLILELKRLGFKVALATITTSLQLEIYYKENKKMAKEMNINETFDYITTQDDVKKKKPDPEIYLTVMKHFDVEPSECLVFEDSYDGVLAAKRAGIEVVNIHDKYSDVDRERINEITDYSIPNYDDFIATCVKKIEPSKCRIRTNQSN